MTYPIGAVILAAGAGRRFGGPKALARVGEESWLSAAAGKIQEAGFGWISIVLGVDAEKVRADSSVGAVSHGNSAGGATISWVLNARWSAGRTGSIACGLSDLPSWSRGAIIHQVDFPFVKALTFRALAEAFEADAGAEGAIFLPLESGRRGHPILVGRDVWPEILEMGPDDPLRNVIHKVRARIREVAVSDSGIHGNINRATDARIGE
ncbi:MAG: nucleotidyltransferase family protein [Candidatus Eisenbacteria sp.]|nr:nucleotidyltransferase family protein [Candidatus Eisenbacteria bacterium]